jgi:hypothetical protein
MKKKPIYKDIYLLFPYGIFFGEWLSYLNSFGQDSRKSRQTSDGLIFGNSISGKGFLIWVSQPGVWSYNGESKWRVVISLTGNNIHGIVLQYLISLGIQQGSPAEIFVPEISSLFTTSSEFLIFAKQSILNSASIEKLVKYGYIDDHGEVNFIAYLNRAI